MTLSENLTKLAFALAFIGVILLSIGIPMSSINKDDATGKPIDENTENTVNILKIVGGVILGLGIIIAFTSQYYKRKGN